MGEVTLFSEVKYKNYDYKNQELKIGNNTIYFFGEKSFLKPIIFETISEIRYFEHKNIVELYGNFETIYEKVDKITIQLDSKYNMDTFRDALASRKKKTANESVTNANQKTANKPVINSNHKTANNSSSNTKQKTESKKKSSSNSAKSVIESPEKNNLVVDHNLLPLFEDYKKELKKIIGEIESSNKQLAVSISKATNDISKSIIEKEFMEDLKALYVNFDNQNDLMVLSSDHLLESIEKIKEAEEKLTNNIEKVSADVSIRVLRETVLNELNELYKQFEGIYPNLVTANKELEKNVLDFIKVKKSFTSFLEEVSDIVSKKVDQIINNEIKKTVQTLEGVSAELSKRLNKLDIVENHIQLVEELEKNNTRKSLAQISSLEQKVSALSKEMTLNSIKSEKDGIDTHKNLNKKIHIYGIIAILLLLTNIFLNYYLK